MLLIFLMATFAVAAAASSSSSSGGGSGGPAPAPPTKPLSTPADLGGYLKRIRDSEDAIAAAKAAGEEENAARISQIKSIAKYIPLLGSTWTSLVDLGAWFGKALGSAYREENRPEDIDALSAELAIWLQRGWVPPNPSFYFSSKVGARSFAEDLRRVRDDADNLSTRRSAGYFFDEGGLSTSALRAIGALTLKWGGDPRLAASLDALGKDQGLLIPSTAYAPPLGQLVVPTFLGALAALETGRDVASMQAKAIDAWKAEGAAWHAGGKNPNAIPALDGEAPFPPTGDPTVQHQAMTADVFLRLLRDSSTSMDFRITLAR